MPVSSHCIYGVHQVATGARPSAAVSTTLWWSQVSPILVRPGVSYGGDTMIGNVERNLHCDVVHITTKCVSSVTLDCNGVFAIKAYRLDTHLVVMCTTSQCKLRSPFRNLRVRNVICIVT